MDGEGAVSYVPPRDRLQATCTSAAHDAGSPQSDDWVGLYYLYSSDSETPFYGRSPPVYPSPLANGTSSSAWTAAYARAKALVAQMTTEEKANVTHGWPGICVGNTGAVPRLELPSLCFADGPDGIRGQEFVSAFPAGIHVGATWDKELMYRYGRALGREYYAKGINVALGPVAGPLGRIARGGRNWEGLSNDPYLSGAGMGAITRGIQDAGVIATPKHWILNEQEFRRRESAMGEAVSSNVDDRTLHELYVFPFMDALRQGAGAVMCSYQRANHSYGCQNSKLLNGILKTELGFEGFVVSDWDAQHSGVASANAGLDVVMPGAGYWGHRLVEAVVNGSVSEYRINDMAARLLASWHLLHQENTFPPPEVHSNLHSHFPVDAQADHAALIRNIGAAGTVLVKNLNDALPLRRPRFLCIYGYDAVVKTAPWENPDRFGGGYDVNSGWNTMNGTLISGGGSGSTTPPYVVSPFQAIQERIAKDRGVLRWDFSSENPSATYVNADACLVFVNAYASESFDRPGLTDAFSDRLIANVAAKCLNTIVVIHSAGIRVVDPWIDHPNITAVLFAGLPGQESGHSLVDVLYGDINPCGRLPYTVAKKETDYGRLLNSSVSSHVFPDDDFSEGLYIDYRAFDRDGIVPRFEFGFGLSYTTFDYKTLAVSLARASDTAEFPDAETAIVQGGHPSLWEAVALASCSISNTGDVSGTEIVQLYLGIPGSDTPVRQLRGFTRLGPLAPGETRLAVFELTRRDLSVWDVVRQQWRLLRGEYRIWVGASSRDLRLEARLTIR
ncbi:glycosyl hydrolase family 3 N terminal domain-containing protein [Coniochaeta ligniaria NRRL 30616]|uniref:beta-glucosidase n=1 Tax=Coniochaeta ligniaria NRRL 30616 TaxID=1408157 RepID=A0A1J7IB73_9PEZI|nr:glycosyl hydrolase family 3 N terminal domain-containing protein [Coniochaeta ligniaria NRRL 30616]